MGWWPDEGAMGQGACRVLESASSRLAVRCVMRCERECWSVCAWACATARRRALAVIGVLGPTYSMDICAGGDGSGECREACTCERVSQSHGGREGEERVSARAVSVAESTE